MLLPRASPSCSKERLSILQFVFLLRSHFRAFLSILLFAFGVHCLKHLPVPFSSSLFYPKDLLVLPGEAAGERMLGTWTSSAAVPQPPVLGCSLSVIDHALSLGCGELERCSLLSPAVVSRPSPAPGTSSRRGSGWAGRTSLAGSRGQSCLRPGAGEGRACRASPASHGFPHARKVGCQTQEQTAALGIWGLETPPAKGELFWGWEEPGAAGDARGGFGEQRGFWGCRGAELC